MKAEDVDKFLGLPKGAFDHIPGYAMEAALEAIGFVRDLEEKNLFRPGLYYIVLCDLTGATLSSAMLSSSLNERRIESFVTATVEALGRSRPSSYAQFVKHIGDASLFIFAAFADVYKWWINLHEKLARYNQEYRNSGKVSEKAWAYFELTAKTVVHMGEVAFEENKNPVSMAVNQVFKVEKRFGPREIGRTLPVLRAAGPTIENLGVTVEGRGSVKLPGDTRKTTLHLIDTFGTKKKDAREQFEDDGIPF